MRYFVYLLFIIFIIIYNGSRSGSEKSKEEIEEEKEKEAKWQLKYNTEYYSSSCMGLVKLQKLENEFMKNFTLYTDDLQEKVNTLNLLVLSANLNL